MGSDEVVVHSPRGFRALRQLVRGSGAQVMFSSLLPVVGSHTGRTDKSIQLIHVSVAGVSITILGSFTME